MSAGQITSLNWSNSCYSGQVCTTSNCVDTSVGDGSSESNCVL